MHNSRHAFARRRRAPIDGTVTRYRIESDGTRRRIDKGNVQQHATPSHADLMIAAQQRGLNPDALAVSASGWDQDN